MVSAFKGLLDGGNSLGRGFAGFDLAVDFFGLGFAVGGIS